MKLLVLGIFCCLLIICVLLEFSVLYPMLAGLILFLLYGLGQGFSARELWEMSFSGVKTIKGLLLVFLIIGAMTGVWRACGTIAVIVSYASDFIRPDSLIVLTFILNSLTSVLIGTALGTAATMGIICMSIANAMDISQWWMGGAILAGVYFGDRWSPVSTSLMLVSSITRTSIYDNMRRMISTTWLPFLISCAIYYWAGSLQEAGEGAMDVRGVFATGFRLEAVCVLPAVVIMTLALMRVAVKYAMLASIACALIIGSLVQGYSIAELISFMVFGFVPADEGLARMISGGGLVSMTTVTAIVCISSCYAGIFKATGLLEPIGSIVQSLRKRVAAFPAITGISVITSAIACNQTLAIMLTDQLFEDLYEDKSQLAMDLEDSVVVLAPLIPWSIAGAVPLALVGADQSSILVALFLYILPIYRCIYK